MSQPGTMKIVTLNLLHGGGGRIGGLIDYLIKTNADAIVCQEFRLNPGGRQLEARLRGEGYHSFHVSESRTSVNRVAIATRQKSTWIKLEPDPIDTPCILGCELDGIAILGVHFPSGKDKASLFDYLLAGWPDYDGERLIIGDFNTGLRKIDEEGATFTCEERFKRLETKGYVDLWRREHGPKARACTWESNRGGEFRLDHAFGSLLLAERVTSCTYDDTTREKDGTKFLLTDHSAMTVEIAPLP